MKRNQGFTLFELMISLSIASILIALAAPSFVEMSVRNRIVTYTNDFIATVNYARSEAVRRGSPVSICKSNDGAGCGGTWSDGWIVFADPNSNASVDAGEEVLRVHEALAPNYSLDADDTLDDWIRYAADGTAHASGVFAVCHKGEVEGARAIVVTRLRPRVARDTDDDRIPNKDSGNINSCTDP